jgi:hypothetical protein
MRGPNIRGLVVAAVVASACRGPAPPVTQRLVDLYKHEAVVDRVEAEPTAPRLEWRFDGPAAKTDKATIDKQPLSGIADLAVRDGHLIGRTTTDFPILDFALPKPIDDSDLVHEIEVRVRVDGGGNLSARLSREEKVSAA